MPDATDADPPRQDAPLYRAAPGGFERGQWVVAMGMPDKLGPAVLAGVKTEREAREAANTLNGLQTDAGRRDEVLGRMLTTKNRNKN